MPDGRSARFYSITAMRRRRPAWFAEDLAALFGLLERGEIHPDVAERLSLHDVPDAHARLERGGLRGKLVVLP